jgi:hypothetical protein
MTEMNKSIQELRGHHTNLKINEIEIALKKINETIYIDRAKSIFGDHKSVNEPNLDAIDAIIKLNESFNIELTNEITKYTKKIDTILQLT